MSEVAAKIAKDMNSKTLKEKKEIRFWARNG